MEEGSIDVFLDCGAQVTNPGCASCLTTSIGVIGDGEVMASTGCFHYSGCCGTPLPGSIWFLRGLPPGGAQRISLSSVTGGHNYGYCFYGPDMEAAR